MIIKRLSFFILVVLVVVIVLVVVVGDVLFARARTHTHTRECGKINGFRPLSCTLTQLIHYVMKVNNCISILNSSVISKKLATAMLPLLFRCVCLFFIVLCVILAQIRSASAFSPRFSNDVNIILFHYNNVIANIVYIA